MFEIAAQSAIYSKLTNNADIMSRVVGIFDAVPQTENGSDTEFPYITIGEAVHSEWDTDNTIGNDVSVTIHVWSRYRGRRETKEIQGMIFNALHRQDLTYEGFDFISIDFEASQSFLDADGLTRHGIQTFRILIDEVNNG